MPLLQTFDLNLLKVFLAVYEFHNITKAADHLGLTQSAVSQALGRLRLHMNDQLFYRGPAGMVPTPKAKEMAEPIRQAVESINTFLPEDKFDPAKSSRHFRLGTLDYGVMVIAPRLVRLISEYSSKITFEILHLTADVAVKMVVDGELDLIVGPYTDLPETTEVFDLFADDYVVIARKNHPKLKNCLTKRLLYGLERVDVRIKADSISLWEKVLGSKESGYKRNVTVPNFSGASFVVSASNMVAIIPRWPAEIYAQVCELSLHDIPFKFDPYKVCAVTNKRNRSDAGTVWLREVIYDMFEDKRNI